MGPGMTTERLDQIVTRNRTRRDLVFVAILAIVTTLGLGALAHSARGAAMPAPAAAAQR